MCEMTKEFYREYLHANHATKKLLYTMNPSKIRACENIIKTHELKGDKIIVFSDDVFALKQYANTLNRPFIYGGSSHVDRIRLLDMFRHNPALNTIFLSKVGDTSIDIPEASVLIQISSHYGSRRQEAQRLGRILRPKDIGGKHNAFFYTLVSRDTIDVFYSSKRRQFLIDQGYDFRVILSNIPTTQGVYSTQKSQVELLNTVLVSRERFEVDVVEKDDLEIQSDEEIKVVRRERELGGFSGGDSLAYMEVKTTSFVAGKRKR